MEMADISHKLRTGIKLDPDQGPFSSARHGVDTASDHSKPNMRALSGVTNQHEWSERKATERYGEPKTFSAPKDEHKPQKLGDSGNLQGPKYDNDVSEGSWLRGGGRGGEAKPGYDPGHRAPHGDEAVARKRSPRSNEYKNVANKRLRSSGDVDLD